MAIDFVGEETLTSGAVVALSAWKRCGALRWKAARCRGAVRAESGEMGDERSAMYAMLKK